MKKKKKSDFLWNLLLLFFVAVFIFSAWKLAGYLVEYKKGEDSYETIVDHMVVMPQVKDEKKDEKDKTDSGLPDENGLEEPVFPQLDWNALSHMNEDFAGWLYIPDTIIHYPIVHGKDNSYYLTHTFDKKSNKCGAIFMDAGNEKDFSSKNTILHGHNMKTGKMFGSLRKYEKKEFWAKHPYIYVILEKNILKYEIFASSRTTAGSDVYTMEFESEESFASYLEKRMSNRLYDTGMEVGKEDVILTLSTCTSDTEEGRRVVQAKLVEVKEKNNE